MKRYQTSLRVAFILLATGALLPVLGNGFAVVGAVIVVAILARGLDAARTVSDAPARAVGNNSFAIGGHSADIGC